MDVADESDDRAGPPAVVVGGASVLPVLPVVPDVTGIEPERLVEALAAAPGGAERAAALAAEDLPAPGGRTALEAARLRGYVLAAFCRAGLPAEVEPHVVASLESGLPYEVAGAAHALQGLERAAPDFAGPLARALRSLAGADARISFEAYRPSWPYAEPTTALTEVVRAIGRLGPDAGEAAAALAALDVGTLPEHLRPEVAKALADL
ncbi:hypothetical protein GCM10009836_11990 [Pseudonocardia ailaonensis]|uniref:Uncharacterized protein n=1 Tax=Pseudonocardia ailaonensis TaxID=367279 RepID=A0ABN2MRK3_9PSEU